MVLVFSVALHDLGAVWKKLNFAEIGTVAFWYLVGASESLSTGINWATIFFIAGICLIVVVQYFALLLRRQKVVKTTVFIKEMNDFAAINEVYKTFFTTDFPARSCVEVARLPKDVMLEIEAIAMK